MITFYFSTRDNDDCNCTYTQQHNTITFHVMHIIMTHSCWKVNTITFKLFCERPKSSRGPPVDIRLTKQTTRWCRGCGSTFFEKAFGADVFKFSFSRHFSQ